MPCDGPAGTFRYNLLHSTPLQYCQAAPVQSFPFSSQPLLPLPSIPFNSNPLRSCPFQILPLQSLPRTVASLPIHSHPILPLRSIPFTYAPVRSVPFRSPPLLPLPFRELPNRREHRPDLTEHPLQMLVSHLPLRQRSLRLLKHVGDKVRSLRNLAHRHRSLLAFALHHAKRASRFLWCLHEDHAHCPNDLARPL